MFYRIKEGKIYDWAEHKFAQDCLETDITTKEELDVNLDRFEVRNGILTDISGTEAYIAAQIQKEKEKNKFQLQAQIDELDKKRVRAIAEPALKDAQSGQTWLEYYTKQIQELRAEM